MLGELDVAPHEDADPDRSKFGSAGNGINQGCQPSPFRHVDPSLSDPSQNSPYPAIGCDELAPAVRVHTDKGQAEKLVWIHHSPRKPSASAAWASPTEPDPSRSAMVRATLRTRS